MHHHIAGLQRALRDDLVTGVKIDSDAAPDPVCEPCLAGKMHALPFRSTGTITSGILDLVHGDLVLNMDTQVWSVQVDNPELLGHQAQ